MSAIAHADLLELARTNTPLYARSYLKIVDKRKRTVAFEMNAAQLELHRLLTEQREAGLPERGIVLKARQVGISTYVQARLIQAATLTANYNGVCLAHDRETGGRLYQMGERMYRGLPDDPDLKPPVRHYSRARFMNFAAEMGDGTLYPDSSYLVDTAGESHAGHGGTNAGIHASEVSRWPNAIEKFTALKITVPREVGTLFLIESVAYGGGLFRELWEDAEAGRSEYLPFFWPWWKQPEYRLALSAGERDSFRIGEGRYGEREPELVNPGPIDTLTGKHVPLDVEQLAWRRMTIANECSTKIDTFDEQFPTIPEDAFRSSGRRVFDVTQVRHLLAATEATDPRVVSKEHPGPFRGKFVPRKKVTEVGRRRRVIEVPTQPRFVPLEDLPPDEAPNWRVWKMPDPKHGYVIGVDVSGGFSETEEGEPAYHAIEVIDHNTGEQVAEYTSRCDPDLLADEVYLAALFYNEAWVAIERTGGWAGGTLRTIWLDYHYTYLYFSQKHGRRTESQEDRLGWDTNRETKPILLAGAAELLREETTGINSRLLALEMQTYVRTEKGATLPEPGQFSDRLMAWMIARQVALEKPVKPPSKRSGVVRTYRARDQVVG